MNSELNLIHRGKKVEKKVEELEGCYKMKKKTKGNKNKNQKFL